MTMAETTTVPSDEPRLLSRSLERSLRLWAGIVLMVFVASHLLNHALGLFGVAFMTEVQEIRVALWRSAPGTVLLAGALSIHVLLTLKRTFSRRTFRMPAPEALQIALGVLIPVLLTPHVVGTRVLNSLAGVDDSYLNMLRFLWPEHALWQTLLLLVVWVHGVIGLHFVFHVKPWFRHFRTAFMLTAVVLPLLALAGFVSSGREAMKINAPPEVWTPTQLAAYEGAMLAGRVLVLVFLAIVAAGVLVRFAQIRLRSTVTVRYTGHGEIYSPKGLTLLEMSRRSHIPHPSACGGRGRCASCRVLILSGQASLPPPTGLERKMLERIRAPLQVRLGCQIRPVADLQVRILLPTDPRLTNRQSIEAALDWGVEKELTMVFADIRGFSSLARHLLPADVSVLLNRVVDELTQATQAHGGRIALVETDGVMAVFGLDGAAKAGARPAIEAAADMLKAVARNNRDFAAALPQPLRIGVGVHTGRVVATRIGDEERGYQLVVIGEVVVAASRLEEATKELAADCIISHDALVAAGIAPAGGATRQIYYKNGETPVSAVVFAEFDDLRRAVGGKSQNAQPAAEELQSPA